jgi:hypothetical protein
LASSQNHIRSEKRIYQSHTPCTQSVTIFYNRVSRKSPEVRLWIQQRLERSLLLRSVFIQVDAASSPTGATSDMVNESSFGKLTEAWEWATLIIDPADVTCMDKLLADPPLLASASLQESTISPSMVLSGLSSSGGEDAFGRLPMEIRITILCLITATSIGALRLASRAMTLAANDGEVWKSRFGYPHELSHFSKPIIKFPSDGSRINWPFFCYSLLNLDDWGSDDRRWRHW